MAAVAPQPHEGEKNNIVGATSDKTGQAGNQPVPVPTWQNSVAVGDTYWVKTLLRHISCSTTNVM